MTRRDLALAFERLYIEWARPQVISPDPLEAVYWYDDTRDREIAGLIAAALAYGRVAQIVESVGSALKPMGASPRAFLESTPSRELDRIYTGFRHRWTTGAELCALLRGIRRTLDQHGSLGECFALHHRATDESTLPALAGFVDDLSSSDPLSSLLSDPRKGSACKRLHLYLRWMIRRDAVDPGCWTGVSPSKLIVPLDTHMHAVARAFRFTRRKQANLAAALDVTKVFRAMNPEDPIRYDFVLTRFGIRNELDMDDLLRTCRA